MRFLMYVRRMALAAAVLWPLAGARAQDVFIRVPVELGGTATRMTLPFGEPFLLVGAAPAQLRRVNARYVMWNPGPPTRARCDTVLTDTAQVEVLSTSPWLRDPQVMTDSFAVLVNRNLRANRRYGICVQTEATLDSASLTRFQSRVYAILDSTYNALNDTAGKPPERFLGDSLIPLRRSLAQAIPTDQGEVNARGTIFDTTATGAKDLNENLLYTAGVLGAQTARFHEATNVTSSSQASRIRLREAAGNAAVLRAIASIGRPRIRVAGMDSVTVELAISTARVLAFPDQNLLMAAAGGEAVLSAAAMPGTQPRRPADVTDPVEIAARAARIDSTLQRIAELRDLTAALEASSVLRSRVGVGRTGAAALRTALDGVQEQFGGLRRNAARWVEADARRHALLVQAARSLRVIARDRVPIIATTISSFETRARQYVTADVGLAYLPGLGEVAPYFGANFYPGALNKRVPLSVAKPRELDLWSITVGVTASSLARKDVREDLFGSLSLLVGAGRRITDPLRLTGGVVVYRELDVNPLVDHTSLAASPFLSLSFDFDAKSALGRLGDTIFH